MKRKIKAIYIDGMEKTGKTSIVRELRKYLKTKEIDFNEIETSGINLLQKQEVIASENPKSLILKQNSILLDIYKNMKDQVSVKDIAFHYAEELRLEKEFNRKHGSIMFFLLPQDEDAAKRMHGNNIPFDYMKLAGIYKSIGQTILGQGLDIRPILIDQEDRIFDVRNKILKILEETSLSS